MKDQAVELVELAEADYCGYWWVSQDGAGFSDIHGDFDCSIEHIMLSDWEYDMAIINTRDGDGGDDIHFDT